MGFNDEVSCGLALRLERQCLRDRYGMGLLQFPNMQKDVTGAITNATFVIGHPGTDLERQMC